MARTVARHWREHGPVSLSLRHLDAVVVRRRFPWLTAQLSACGLDLARDPVPVALAAHYCMGGVTLATLAEVARTGVDDVSLGALTHSAGSLDFSLIVL